MALIKTITCDKTGITASFWKTHNINYDVLREVVEYTQGGYISEQHFLDGKDAVMFERGEFAAGTAPTLASGAIALVQTHLKEKPHFEGAEDA